VFSSPARFEPLSSFAGVTVTRSFIQLVERLSKAFAVLSVLLLLAAMLVVCQLIFIRYVFRSPTIWHTDFVVYAATASIFLGAPYVLLTKGHVGVDVIDMLLSAPVKRRLHYIGGLAGLTFCFAMFIASMIYFLEALHGGWETSGIWKIPLWLPTLPMPVGFGLLSLQYVAELIKLGRAE
jgi:TRAP-type C4-dicarboxylate transport system permease small subunit